MPRMWHEGRAEILSSSFSNRFLSESIQWNFAVTGIDIFELVKDVKYQLHRMQQLRADIPKELL